MRKKILFIHHHGGIGGAGLSFIHIVKSIDKNLYDLTILCPKISKQLMKLLENEECKIIESDYSPKIFPHYNGGIKSAISPRTFKNIIEIIKDRKNIDRYIKEVKPEIVMVNSMTMCFLGKIAKKNGCKTICFHRETYQKGLLGVRTKLIKYNLAKYFDKVAFISKFDSLKTGNINGTKYLIYDKVDFNIYESLDKMECRRKLGLDEKNKYILYMGGYSRLKGAHLIVKSIKKVNSDNTYLLFLGNKDERKGIKGLFYKYIEKNIYKNKKIIFFENTSKPEIFIKASDLVVFPSTKAHQARPIYECGISKIPILISDFKETREFIGNEKNALTFKVNNIKDLSCKLNYILNNKEKIEGIIENNYKQTIKKHNLKFMSAELKKLLEF